MAPPLERAADGRAAGSQEAPMRGALVAVVLGLSLLGTRSVPAAPFSTAFDDLKADLESRRDNDFGGTLDAAKKKQQKAVLKCLALLEKPSATALNDMKTFGAVAKALAKGYPEERALGFSSTLWFSLVPVFNGVDAPFGGDLYDLRTAIGRMVPNAAFKKASRF